MDNLISKAVKQLESEIERKNMIENSVLINSFFDRFLIMIKELKLQKQIILSLTNSNSLYIRFTVISLEMLSLETHIEIFYLEDNEDNIEAITTIYNRDNEILKDYGSLNAVLKNIQNHII